ncbi:MAG TPA: hypothetical protein VK697_04980 [Methylomirabilota bacterium]|nr:hypothetical protein [Methylomirabilota bacterium]
MAESRQALATMPDEELAGALRHLATSIDFSTAGPSEPGSPDLAARVRRRIEQNPLRPSLWRRLGLGVGVGTRARPIRRGLVLALVALLVLAAVAGAVGFGLPGLRIIFGEGPSPTASPPAPSSASPRPSQPGPSEPGPSATVQPLGGSLGLGDAVPLAEVRRQASFEILLPTDPPIGLPDVSYLNDQRVTLVWASGAVLPETNTAGIGLVLGEFRGNVDQGYYEKVLGDQTIVTPVTVNGGRGYWIHGGPHFFYYIDPQGQVVTDESRVVGDVLIWTRADVTFRLETSLGMAAAIRLAESLR